MFFKHESKKFTKLTAKTSTAPGRMGWQNGRKNGKNNLFPLPIAVSFVPTMTYPAYRLNRFKWKYTKYTKTKPNFESIFFSQSPFNDASTDHRLQPSKRITMNMLSLQLNLNSLYRIQFV